MCIFIFLFSNFTNRTFDENKLAKTFKLRLENIDVPDFGRYKCKVRNPCSKSITNTVNIIVRGNLRLIYGIYFLFFLSQHSGDVGIKIDLMFLF